MTRPRGSAPLHAGPPRRGPPSPGTFAILLAVVVWAVLLPHAHAEAGRSIPRSGDTAVAPVEPGAILAPCLVVTPALPDTLEHLLTRAKEFLEALDGPRADSTAGIALAIANRAPGPDSFYVAKALDVAVLIGNARRPAEAAASLATIRSVLRLKEARFGPVHPEIAATLDVLGFVLVKLTPRDTPGALAAFRRSLEIRERCCGASDPLVATSLVNLARIAGGTSSDSLVEPWLRRAIAILERHPADTPLAFALDKLADRFTFSATPEAGVEPARRALAICEERLGAGDRRIVNAEGTLGFVLLQAGQADEGLVHLQRARDLAEEIWGPNSNAVATTTWNLGGAYGWRGDLEQAAALERQAIAIKIALNPHAAGLGDLYRLLAMNLMSLGEFAAAKDTLELAVRLDDQAFGEHSDASARARAVLAELLRGPLGSPEEATPLMERASGDHWAARAPGDRGPVQELFDCQMLQGMAECYLSLGDTARARPQVERLAALLARHPESTELNRLDGQLSLARMLRDMGRFDEARDHLAGTLRTFERAYLPGQPILVAGIRDLADLECRFGRLDEAERLLADARRRQEEFLGPDHPEVAQTCLALARVQALRGERSEALANARQAERCGREHACLTMQTLSERRSLAFVATRANAVPLLVRLAFDDREERVTRPTWDAVILSRSLVLDELAERRRLAGRTGDCMAEYTEASTELARLVVQGAGKDLSLTGYRTLLDGARRRSENAAERLAKSCTAFRTGLERRRAGLDAVTAALPARAALISYVRVPAESLLARRGLVRGRVAAGWESPDHYVAFVLGAAAAEPELVEIGPAARVDSLVEAWRREAGSPPDGANPERSCADAGRRLRETVWDPVAKWTGGAARVFVVPDGTLNLVNVAALPDARGGFLVEGGADIHCLSAERDLVRAGRPPPANGLLAIGAPAFDAEPSSGTGLLASGGLARDDGAGVPTYRGPHAQCPDFRTVRFEPLPATRRELDDVTTAWERGADRDSEAGRFVGAAASEAAFKREAGSHRVLHIATHGFFVGGRCAAVSAGTRGIGGVTTHSAFGPLPVAAENPLLLSGLALAGANRRDEAGRDQEDGILTAEEIASLDLSGVEWAVLSACETGVGEVRAGEGVFGLRRAFQVAGARTLIMSLWSVEDEATRAWMRALYEARLERHLDTAESVRAASLAVLQERRAKGLSTHPFWWGAFVAAGDWR